MFSKPSRQAGFTSREEERDTKNNHGEVPMEAAHVEKSMVALSNAMHDEEKP